jgi:hypothetical protein
MSVDYDIRTIVAWHKFCSTFLTFCFVFATSVECVEHNFLSSFERKIGGSVRVGEMCLGDLGKHEIISCISDVYLEIFNYVPGVNIDCPRSGPEALGPGSDPDRPYRSGGPGQRSADRPPI